MSDGTVVLFNGVENINQLMLEHPTIFSAPTSHQEQSPPAVNGEDDDFTLADLTISDSSAHSLYEKHGYEPHSVFQSSVEICTGPQTPPQPYGGPQTHSRPSQPRTGPRTPLEPSELFLRTPRTASSQQVIISPASGDPVYEELTLGSPVTVTIPYTVNPGNFTVSYCNL